MNDHTAPFRTAINSVTWPDWVTWTVTFTQKTRSTIRVGGAGQLTLDVGTSSTPDRVAVYIQAEHTKLLAEAEAMRDRANLVTKQLVSGEGFNFAGRPYRLRVVRPDGRSIGRDAVRQVTVNPGAMCADEPGPSGWSGHRSWQLTLRVDANERHIIDWYRRRGLELLNERIPPLADRLGLKPGLRWRVRSYRPGARVSGSWGTYSNQTRTVALDWLAFQLPAPMLDYLIAHEVAHGVPGSRGHDKVWQSAMDRVCHGWRELRTPVRKCSGLTLWTGQVEPRPAGWPYDFDTENDPAPETSGWDVLSRELEGANR